MSLHWRGPLSGEQKGGELLCRLCACGGALGSGPSRTKENREHVLILHLLRDLLNQYH
jgi:hypothetical protein